MAKKKYTVPVIAAMMYAATLGSVDSSLVDNWVKGECGGKERWEVKTLHDADAPDINFKDTVISTIAQLRKQKPPSKVSDNLERQEPEKRIYKVRCKITACIKEDDEDLHLVLEDADGRTLIGEIVFPYCPDIKKAKTKKMLERIYKKFQPMRDQKVFGDYTCEVTGVGFFDFIHGQTGVAPYGFELHPILEIKPVK